MSNTSNLQFTSDMYTVEKHDDGEVHVTLTEAATVYAARRPDTITAEHEKAVDTYRQEFVAATVEGAADIVAATMKKDETVETVKLFADVGKALHIEASVDRSRVGKNPKTQEQITTYGACSVRVKTAYRKVGPIRTACEKMSSRIKDELGN